LYLLPSSRTNNRSCTQRVGRKKIGEKNGKGGGETGGREKESCANQFAALKSSLLGTRDGVFRRRGREKIQRKKGGEGGEKGKGKGDAFMSGSTLLSTCRD